METTVSKSQPTSLARRIGGSQPYYTPVQRTPQHQLHHHQKQQQQQLPLHHQPPAQSTPAVAQNPAGLVNLYGGTNPPTPSPRRKLSNSSFGNPNPTPSTTANPNPQADVFEEFRVGGGIGPPPLYAPADYLRNGPSYSNDGGNYRNGYFGKGIWPLILSRNLITYPCRLQLLPVSAGVELQLREGLQVVSGLLLRL